MSGFKKFFVHDVSSRIVVFEAKQFLCHNAAKDAAFHGWQDLHVRSGKNEKAGPGTTISFYGASTMMERAKVVRSFVLRVHEAKNCTYIVRLESVFVNGYKFPQQIET